LLGFEDTSKPEVIELSWRILHREFTKFGIHLQKTVKDNIQHGHDRDIRDLLVFLLDFERSGGPEKIAHTILAAASIPIIPIIGKEYQMVNPLPQIKAMAEKNIPKLRFRNEQEEENQGKYLDSSFEEPRSPLISEDRPESLDLTSRSFNETYRDHYPFRPHNPYHSLNAQRI
jgi:hypothetical protein